MGRSMVLTLKIVNYGRPGTDKIFYIIADLLAIPKKEETLVAGLRKRRVVPAGSVNC